MDAYQVFPESDKLTVGQDIVAKSKSPFADDETVARWIDNEIAEAVRNAKNEEQKRIGKLIAELSPEGLETMLKTNKFLHGGLKMDGEIISNVPPPPSEEDRKLNRAERRAKK